MKHQSTSAALSIQRREEAGEIILPATSTDVSTPSKALDTDDLVILIGTMAVAWLIAVGSYAYYERIVFAIAVLIWSVGMVIFIFLLVFVQSRTWLQMLNIRAHRSNESKRISAQERVMKYYYDTEKEKEQIREEAKVKISEIYERLRLSAQTNMQRQVEEHSVQQSSLNRLDNYVAPDEVPYRDSLRERLLMYLLSLYDEGMDDGGRITVAVPWSARGNMNKDKIVEMFRQAEHFAGFWVVKQMENKHWYVNRDKLTTPDLLEQAFKNVYTPK